ncbi:protein PAF1 homolog [Mangifera indica]|uniref:protein PAF1 homolog n=1 Tax=Mangifera indica TaxID=29780 RepID=UPI001CFA2492|nr:protein PAF1 homolog [Mangifera indica]
MASYRPFAPPPQSSFPPPPPPTNQNPTQPAPPPPPASTQPPQRPNQFNQNWGYNAQMPPQQQQNYPPAGPPPPPRQQYPYAQPPPPPPPESSYPPPPPPPPPQQQPQQPPMYYPASQYTQNSMYNLQPPLQPLQPPLPPPPPSSPPPSSSIPPPPPPSSPPPPPPPKEIDSGGSRFNDHDRRMSKDVSRLDSRDHGHPRQHKPPVPPQMVKKVSGGTGRVETEEERRLRKKKEFEKQRQEEKQRQQMKESQNAAMQKTHMMASAKGGHGSIVGSRMGDRRATPFLSGERIENRLKKPTTFLCKLKFRNELPDPSAQPKLMTLKKDKDRFTRYTITSLEKNYKPQLYVEPDLGIPLDLLDLNVYNPPKGVRIPLAPEDEELLRDDDVVTPVKKDGIRKKERPTDKGVSWLVKTQYISPLSMESTRLSLTEKQAKEMKEMKGGRNILDNLNDRDRQIKDIEASFEASKLRPIHSTNKSLRPVQIWPLVPDFERYDDQFVVALFDGVPTADSEIYSRLDQSVRDEHESRAVMKSYVATGSDPANPDKFLAYMVPSVDELSKDMYDENEDVSFSWVREYHWDVRGDDADDPTSYLVSFDDDEARYVPLPTKLNLRKKRAREGRANEDVEHFPVPSRLTVRRRSSVAVIEPKDAGAYSNSRGTSSKMARLDAEDSLGRSRKLSRHQDLYHSSGAEDDLSD